MLPCYSLFLEVEVPDPSLNYFIVGQDQLDNTEHLLAPPPLGQNVFEVLPEVEEAYKFWDDGEFYLGFKKQANGEMIDWRWNATESRYEYFAELHWWGRAEEAGRVLGNCLPTVYFGQYQDGATVNHTFYELSFQPDGYPKSQEIFFYGDITEQTTITFEVGLDWLTGPNEPDDAVFKEVYFTVPSKNTPEVIPTQPQQPNAIEVVEPPDPEPPDPEPEACEPSGNNTFTLGVSCLDGSVDLLEGWGSTKPDHIWVDVITDTTEITIDRGFDMKQGIVGTPIAGIMEALVVDPYLDGIETQKVAVGQRVRLRAGNEVVFSGVCSSVRSEYDAVNTPILRIESVDALGLLNAQMVDVRPQELYNTRLAESASKVEIPIIQQDSTTVLNPTEDPMSALDLLVETQDSEGSVVWLDRFGTMYSTNRYWLDDLNIPVLRGSRFGEAVKYTFTNNVGKEDEEIGIGGAVEEVCLSAYRQVTDTAQVINGITFYNYVEEDDTDFEGLPIKTIVRDTYTFESATSRRLYGDASVRLTTYLPPNELSAYADYIFSKYDTPKTKVETIQFPMDKWKSLDVPNMVSLDIGDPVNVRIDDPLTQHNLNRATQRIAQIRHRITPVEWLCELDLL